eukprot:CAMPEP_0178420198 /NCGR_PEP_ID=MMETSP0689_2-20121128/26005_1 /TAXON_ID=160604 /ORGANISM="Amphidinium massartii, Strain CS-259" /LENGTH=80 /DNA_ID=CAMNT_0020041665 /DNA_START=66 /DNA_END=305 /DNA_ORIENTATION=+
MTVSEEGRRPSSAASSSPCTAGEGKSDELVLLTGNLRLNRLSLRAEAPALLAGKLETKLQTKDVETILAQGAGWRKPLPQ